MGLPNGLGKGISKIEHPVFLVFKMEGLGGKTQQELTVQVEISM